MPDYKDIRTAKENNPSGTKLMVYFCPVDDFESLSALPSAPATAAEANVIVDPHTFAAASGKGFHKLEVETNKNELNAEFMGAVMGGSQKHTFSGFHTGLGDESIALLEKAAREKHIVLVPLRDGKVIQLGDQDNGAVIRSNFQSGLDDGGERGFPVTVEWHGYIQRYDGVISFAADNPVV